MFEYPPGRRWHSPPGPPSLAFPLRGGTDAAGSPNAPVFTSVRFALSLRLLRGKPFLIRAVGIKGAPAGADIRRADPQATPTAEGREREPEAGGLFQLGIITR